MSGNEHYGKIMGRSFSDRRLHLAGSHLAASGMVNEELAVLTIVGTIAALNFRLLEDGDTGVLPGTGREMMRVAAFCSPAMADALIAAMKAGDLLVESGGGLRLRGFTSANERILSARKYQRDKRKRGPDRRPTAPPTASPTVPPTRSIEGEGEGKKESPPTPSGGGQDAAPKEPKAEAPPEPDGPYLEAVYSVHGKDPKRWPGGALKWRSEAERCRKAGVTPDAWKALLATHPLAKPWEVADDAVREAEASATARRNAEDRLSRSERERRARFEERCRFEAAGGPERLSAWLSSLPENRRNEADAILSPPRAAS